MLRIRIISGTDTDRPHLLDADDRRMPMKAFRKRVDDEAVQSELVGGGLDG